MVIDMKRLVLTFFVLVTIAAVYAQKLFGYAPALVVVG